MAITPAMLRENFPEFANEIAYPDSAISFWAGVAELLLNKSRWLTLLDLGSQMFVAHHLVLERQAQRAAAAGGVPGTQIGVVTSKSVDKVSVSYDQSAMAKDAGHWAMTTYGLRFWNLVQMFGAGPIHVGVGCLPGPLSSANAWAGPWTSIIPSMNN